MKKGIPKHGPKHFNCKCSSPGITIGPIGSPYYMMPERGGLPKKQFNLEDVPDVGEPIEPPLGLIDY